MPKSVERRQLILLLGAWVLLAAITILFAKQNLSVPGLYYDEAVFGGMAKDFISARAHSHIPEAEIITLGGRPFPLLVQPYLGGLKAWMLMPSLAAFGSSVPVLRLTTVVWAIIALLVIMLAVWRWLGLTVSIVTGLLLAFDPNWFFLSVLDWGASVPSFFCRGACLYFLMRWIERPKTLNAFLAGLFAGLGVFNKVDFALFLVGTAVTAGVCYWREIRASFRTLVRAIIPAVAGFILGCAPLLSKIPWIFSKAAAASTPPVSAQLEEKLSALTAMADGTYFYRLMNAGGVFERMSQVPIGARSGLVLGLLAATSVITFAIVRGQSEAKLRRAAVFTFIAGVFITAMVIALPLAVRIHHFALAMPLPHLLIAIAITSLLRAPIRITFLKHLDSLVVLAAIALLLGSDLRVIHTTQELIGRTGGRGWWSDSLDSFCREIRTRSDLTIVSLDWGFNEQLGFLTDGPKLQESFWSFEEKPEPLPSDSHYIYLAHPSEYSEYGYDTYYLESARKSAVPVKIEPHVDREGHIAFYSIQFLAP